MSKIAVILRLHKKPSWFIYKLVFVHSDQFINKTISQINLTLRFPYVKFKVEYTYGSEKHRSIRKSKLAIEPSPLILFYCILGLTIKCDCFHS